MASSQKQHPGRPCSGPAGVLNRASSFMLDATTLGRKELKRSEHRRLAAQMVSKTEPRPALLDHLVGAGAQRGKHVRNVDPNRCPVAPPSLIIS
jgi:hypothetical protein